MKIKTFILFAAMLLAAAAFAADKLAVAEPVAKGGMKSEEIDALWGMLETSVKSEEYKLITRGASAVAAGSDRSRHGIRRTPAGFGIGAGVAAGEGKMRRM